MKLQSQYPKPQGWVLVAGLLALVLSAFAAYFAACTLGIEFPARQPSQYDEPPADPARSGNPTQQRP